MIFRINKTNVVLLLLLLNLMAPIIWFFGYHTIYLSFIAGTGAMIFLLFVAHNNLQTAFLFKLLLIFMTLLSLLHVHFGFDYYVFMANDLSTLGLFATPFMLGSITASQIKKSLLVIFVVSAIFSLYILQYLNFAMIGIADRTEIYRELSVYARGMGLKTANMLSFVFSVCVAYSIVFLLYLPLIAKKINKKVLYFILFILLLQILFYVVFFQKRQSLLELFVILALAATINRKLYSGLFTRNLLINIFAFGLISYLILTLPVFKPVFLRFATTAENIQQFDRFEEVRRVLSEFEVVNYFIGHGLGWASTKAVSTGNTIHIGYMNLFMKGGFLFLLFYLFQCVKNIIYCKKKSKIYPEYTVGVSITFFSMFQLLIAPGYGWYFQSILTGMAMFSRFFLDALVSNEYQKHLKPTKSKQLV